MKSITPTLVKSLKPKDKRYSSSSENLQITVHPSGRIVFQSYTQIKGRYVRRPLATFPDNRIDAGQIKELQATYSGHYLDYMGGKLPLTPMEEARIQREAKKDADSARAGQHQQMAEDQRLADGGWALFAKENPDDATFGSLFNDWAEDVGYLKKTFVQDERMFNNQLKALRHIPLFAIDRKMLVSVIRKVNGRTQPNRVRALLSRVFNWGVDNDYLDASPAIRLPSKPENKRHRFLSDKEIPSAWSAMRPIHKFLLCTGQRREEAAAMRWSQLDGNRWTLPETKNSFPHTLLLPAFAMKWLPEQEEGYDCIWRTRKDDFPVHKDTVTDWWMEARGEVNLSDVTVHDFRRTVITNLTKVTRNDTIGRKVANQALQGVKKSYDLYAWDDDKAAALEKWNAALQTLLR